MEPMEIFKSFVLVPAFPQSKVRENDVMAHHVVKSIREFLDFDSDPDNITKDEKFDATFRRWQHGYHHGPYCDCHLWYRFDRDRL